MTELLCVNKDPQNNHWLLLFKKVTPQTKHPATRYCLNQKLSKSYLGNHCSVNEASENNMDKQWCQQTDRNNFFPENKTPVW